MNQKELQITYIGGPTAILEWGGLRFLTDPTFDPAGGEYRTGPATLRKFTGPAIPPESVGKIDVVLLSHDHHFDNLDRAGRAFLGKAGRVITTPAGAGRLGGQAVGVADWQGHEVPAPDGRILRITGTPGRHGPPDVDRGPVTGFALAFADAPEQVVYVSGDTVWYDGVAEVARRFQVKVAVLFMGAARVPEVGPYHLTMTAEDGIRAAAAFSTAAIVPLHFEGWAHFSESREQITQAFVRAGIGSRLRWVERGATMQIATHPG